MSGRSTIADSPRSIDDRRQSPVDRWCLARARRLANGPRRALPKLPIGKVAQNFATVFVSGWSAGWRGVGRADGRVTVTGTCRKQFFANRSCATKFFDFYFF
jgi:hypothetical protein